MARLFSRTSKVALVFGLVSAMPASAAARAPVATLSFEPLGSATTQIGQGEEDVSLEVFDQEVGVVGFRVKNNGRALSSIEHLGMSDGASMLVKKGFQVAKDEADQQVHFVFEGKNSQRALAAAAEEGAINWDLSLVRRKELSRSGRMLHTNGINGHESLTLLVRPVSEVFDADLLADALSSCVLRLGVQVRGQDGKQRSLINRCDKTV